MNVWIFLLIFYTSNIKYHQLLASSRHKPIIVELAPKKEDKVTIFKNILLKQYFVHKLHWVLTFKMLTFEEKHIASHIAS